MAFDPSTIRVVFMGTPAFSLPTLQALIEEKYNVVGVFTQPPKPVGRGYKIQKSPIHIWAEDLHIPVFTPKSLRKEPAFVEKLKELKPDVIVTAAYGLILPQSVLDIPLHGCVNMHGSLLPRWRGASPMQRAIMAGDTESGVTLMIMEAGMDTGPMLWQERVPLTNQTTLSKLHDTLAKLNGKIIKEQLSRYLQGELIPTPQPEEGVTHAPKIDKAEGKIDWQEPADVIHRRFRALTPWPGVYCYYQDTLLKVIDCHVRDASSTQDAMPGQVLDDELTIACGNNTALQLSKVQKAGKQAMNTADFLRGLPIKVGKKLS